MSTASVSIDRSSLSLPPLVIASDGATYRLTENGLGRPGRAWRLTSMPDSADVHGTEYVAAALQQTSLPLEVFVLADTTAGVAAAVASLEDALSQFTYSVTRTVDGVTDMWSASPADMSASDNQTAWPRVQQFFDILTITIPLYPVRS